MAQTVDFPKKIVHFPDLPGRRSASSGIAAANNFDDRALFSTVTSADFARSFKAFREGRMPNSVAEQIRAAEISILR